MAGNVFDQFDQPPAPQAAPARNVFDQFDAPAASNSPRAEFSSPTGFATRAQREGGDMQESEYL